MQESPQPQPTTEVKTPSSPPPGSSALSGSITNSMLVKLFQTQAVHQVQVSKLKQQLAMLTNTATCFDSFLDTQGKGYATAGDLFMFTSSILNEDQNSQMLESVLSYGIGAHGDSISSEMQATSAGGWDDSVLSPRGVAHDFVLEIRDCEAYFKAHDTQEKGAISREDFTAAIGFGIGQDSFATKSITSKRSDDAMAVTLREQETVASSKHPEVPEQQVQQLLAQLVCTEAIFLSKIQSPFLKSIAAKCGKLDNEAIFSEIATDEEGEFDHPVVTRKSFNKYLQDNGACFSSRLTDGFLRRFCRLSADLVLQPEEFKAALCDHHTSVSVEQPSSYDMPMKKNTDLDVSASEADRQELLDELFSLSNTTLSKGFCLTRASALEDFALSGSIGGPAGLNRSAVSRGTMDKSQRSTLIRSTLNRSHGPAFIPGRTYPLYAANDSFTHSKRSRDTLNQRQEMESASQSFYLSKTLQSRKSTVNDHSREIGVGPANDSSFAFSRSHKSRGSSVQERRMVPAPDTESYNYSQSNRSRSTMSRWGVDAPYGSSLARSKTHKSRGASASRTGADQRNGSFAFSRSQRSQGTSFSKSRCTSFSKSHGGNTSLNLSQRRPTSKTLKERADSMNKSLVSDFASRLNSIGRSRDNSFYKTVLSDFNRDSIRLQHSLIRSSLKKESMRMTQKTDNGTTVDFALTSASVDGAMKVIQQLNTLYQFLDLLRMRLAIQEDYTLGALVSLFDPGKKGFVTIGDLRQADEENLLTSIEEDDLHNIFTQSKSSKSLPLKESFSGFGGDYALSYQGFVKLFMPTSDKRFIALVIQRSERAKQQTREKATPEQAMRPETKALANQLVKSTAIYHKYRVFIDEHTKARDVQIQQLELQQTQKPKVKETRFQLD